MAPDGALHVSVDVTNTGGRAGKEVVQLYLRDAESRLVRPEKELKGFAKVALAPGETKTVTLTIDCEALAYWDDARQSWVAEAGEFEVLVGTSSQDIRAGSFHAHRDGLFRRPRRQLDAGDGPPDRAAGEPGGGQGARRAGRDAASGLPCFVLCCLACC